MKYVLGLLAASLTTLVMAADIELRPPPGGGVAITDEQGQDIHLRVLGTGEIFLPAMTATPEMDEPVCYDVTTGQLGNCPAGAADGPSSQEIVVWADSSAQAAGDGSPGNPYGSLQAAITAAANSATATTFGMRARIMVNIASNSVFDEDIIIPPARHIQLMGQGPWVLGNADLANFQSSTPRNITIQTSPAAEAVYTDQGPSFQARPVTVIGTRSAGTASNTHSAYTNGAIISGDIILQNVDPVDPFTTIELQLLNASVVGDIVRDGVDPHQGTVNAYVYGSRLQGAVNVPGMRILRMVDSRTDSTITVAGFSHIANSHINGNVTVTSTLTDMPPTGVFNTQFSTITWTGPIVLDTASNYYFVNSGSTLVGSKTILFSLA